MFQSPVAPGQDAERRISLSEAIDMALRQNRDLQLAQLGVAESRAKKAEARSSYFPRIRNESGVAHITELAGVQIPAGAFGHSASTGLIPAETLFIGQGGSTSYTSGTGLTQPLTQMFKIKNANRAADADLRTSQIELGEAENGIALKVRQLYFSTLIAREQRDAAQFEIDATLTKGKETTEDIAQGRALEVASLESHAALLNAKQSLLTTQIKLRNLSLALNDLLGLPLETHLLLEDSPTEYRVLLPLREDAIRRLLTDSPRVKAAEQTLAKAKAGNAVAKDSYIPDVTGLARYSYQSGVPFLVHNFGTIGFALTYDLFDGGKKKADLDASKARLHQAEVNLEKVKEETTVEIETAYNKVEELKSLVSVAQEALQTRQELARITLEQFNRDATLASSRDNAVAKVHQAQASFLEAMLGQSLAEADILRILGESPR
jgi:outer membrane protein TolC